jgi:hypothetical protein
MLRIGAIGQRRGLSGTMGRTLCIVLARVLVLYRYEYEYGYVVAGLYRSYHMAGACRNL